MALWGCLPCLGIAGQAAGPAVLARVCRGRRGGSGRPLGLAWRRCRPLRIGGDGLRRGASPATGGGRLAPADVFREGVPATAAGGHGVGRQTTRSPLRCWPWCDQHLVRTTKLRAEGPPAAVAGSRCGSAGWAAPVDPPAGHRPPAAEAPAGNGFPFREPPCALREQPGGVHHAP